MWLALLLTTTICLSARAQQADSIASTELTTSESYGHVFAVGTRNAPPFAMRNANGEWQGISIDLLAATAREMGFRYTLRETDLDGMISDVEAGTLDGSIAAMTVTAARENRIDFSHPFYQSSLGVAVATTPRLGFRVLFDALLSDEFLSILATVFGLIVVVGILAWLVERRRNPEEFETDARRGLFSGIWWAAVTMTTTGYGDKTPITGLGRVIAIVWMFAGLVLTATFTAKLAASFTAHSLQSVVSSPSDLAHLRVGNVKDSASLESLQTLGARPIGYPDVVSGLRAVASGEIDAFVHDEPILVWNISGASGVMISPVQFAPQDYAIVLRPNDPNRESINRALIKVLESAEWTTIKERYLGKDN